jgi:hypothetical protein
LNAANSFGAVSYRADGYRWSYNTGFRGYPKHKKEKALVKRQTNSILTAKDPYYGDKRFRAYLYKLPIDGPTELLVHYVGDSSVSGLLLFS